MPRRWPSITSRIRPVALVRLLGQELLGRGEDRFRVRLHLDLRHRFHGHRHALPRVQVLLRRHVERHQLERQPAAILHHRKDHRAAALHHPRAAQAVYDDRFVRTGLAEQLGERHQNEQQDQDA
jgi:hypothetical protein